MLIGIDYSINSPAVCTETAGFYNFFTVQRKDSKVLRKLDMLNDVQCITIEKEGMTDFEFIDKQTSMLVEYISTICSIHDETEICIGLEDYIYYSQQNSLIDIVQATTLLKYKIIKKWGEGVLNKYSPTKVKKSFTGSGKATKDDMLFAYQKLDMKNPFHNWCCSLTKSHKPEEDFIDSFAVLSTLKEDINNNSNK